MSYLCLTFGTQVLSDTEHEWLAQPFTNGPCAQNKDFKNEVQMNLRVAYSVLCRTHHKVTLMLMRGIKDIVSPSLLKKYLFSPWKLVHQALIFEPVLGVRLSVCFCVCVCLARIVCTAIFRNKTEIIFCKQISLCGLCFASPSDRLQFSSFLSSL